MALVTSVPRVSAAVSPVSADPPTRKGTRSSSGRLRTLQLAVLAAFLTVWWAVARFSGIDPVILPGPEAVLRDLTDASRCTADGVCGVQGYFLWQHLLATLQRIVTGLLAGSAVGVALGWWLGSSPKARAIVEPYLSFVRALPPLGYIGLLIVWFGVGDVSKVILLFLAVFPAVAVSTVLGVTGVRQDWLLAARTLGADRWQELRRVVIPGAAPEIINGLRTALGLSWACIVAAEMNDGIPGIGGLAYISGTQLNTSMAIGSIIVIGLVALAMDQALARLQRRVSPGRGK